MIRHALAALALILGLLPLAGWSVEPSIAPEPGVLVLRNGRVLEGRIIRVGDRYRVALGEMAEVSLPAANVEFHCRTLRHAYQLKQAAIRPERVDEVLDLADWCLDQDLHREAAEQLLRAIAVDPESPRIRVLERRLQVAVGGTSGPVPATAVARPTVDGEQVEQALEDLPTDSVASFTSHIQPLLLNRCAAPRCHGPRPESGYQLTAASRGFRLTARITQRNLYRTLQYVNREQPADSSLLRTIAKAHADLPGPVFDEQEADKLALLRQWVHGLVRSERRARPVRLARPDTGTPVSSGPPDIARANGSGVMRAGFFEEPSATRPIGRDPVLLGQPTGEPTRQPSGQPNARPVGEPTLASSSDGGTSRPPPFGSGSANTSPPELLPPLTDQGNAFQPRDPFDPEIFNRRYRRRPVAPRR